MKGLITSKVASARILRAMPPQKTERVPLSDAAGCVLREDIRSDRAQPPYDRVTMDGYALNSSAWKNGVRSFPVLGTQSAGAVSQRLGDANACIEVMTGAVLPRGCDSVVPFERTKRVGNTVEISELEPGRFIHRAGSDSNRGDIVLRSGSRLDGPAIGIAAAVGRTSLLVSRPPRIAVVSTGDEVVPVSTRPKPHQIRASNAAAVAASLRIHGFTNLDLRHITDDERALNAGLREVFRAADVVILTGGVSKGRFDFVPAVLAKLGVEKILHGVAQQPGKPLWFGKSRRGQVVFGLPGNPVSVLACIHRYVLPALGRGAARKVRLLGKRNGPEGLTLFRPVRLKKPDTAALVRIKNSGDFFALAGSDGFVEIPPGHKGEPVRFYPWRHS